MDDVRFDDAVFSEHALDQMLRREIQEEQVRHALRHPEAVMLAREGRYIVHQALVIGHPPREYLLRIFIDVDRVPAEVVTVYRTSKVAKYRSLE